jgi:hypothetical protein
MGISWVAGLVCWAMRKAVFKTVQRRRLSLARACEAYVNVTTASGRNQRANAALLT